MSADCHDCGNKQSIKHLAVKGSPLIALAGQPNVGKSTIFNLLTGLNQHVGNWPGKTVERKEGKFKVSGREYRLVDLPGTYSLTANSPEELITREFILTEKPDLVVALVNAANLERSLYLVAELVTLPAPLIVVLNMMDVASQQGFNIEANVLEAALGVPVVPLTATHAASTAALVGVIEKMVTSDIVQTPRMPEIRADHQVILEKMLTLINDFVPEQYPANWVAIKLLEGDKEITKLMQSIVPLQKWSEVHALLKDHDDAMLAIASGRYEWIGRLTRAAVTHPRIGQVSLTDRLDKWVAHPVAGLITLALILGLVFWLTFSLGSPVQEWLDTTLVGPFGELLSSWLAASPGWLRSLVVDGIVGGVGSVLTFLPILVIFFAAFGFLEDVGYMARAAYVMDNFMHWMGLHGKSFLPLFLGFGCNVPAVIGTRVIDSWKSRLLTILLAPFVPCTARMAVVAFLAPAFFGKDAMWVIWGLVFFSLFVMVLLGVILNKLLFKGERSAFIMEMPLYHIPNFRTVGLLVWQRSISFVKKAGTIILVISVVVWSLSMLPDGNLENSILARIGHFIEPVGRWMGMDWKLTVALLTSFVAKENAIATLGILFGGMQDASLAQSLAAIFTPASALGFLTVSLLFVPCVATLAVIKQETGSWKWTMVNIVLMLVVSIGAGAGVYHLASALGA
ncbi:MAG TPA: ferrous iron transport protein B [Anaerolineaceae bacterium]|nr:ferrous iron transport protein B [Anaerolineaceae bacterium]